MALRIAVLVWLAGVVHIGSGVHAQAEERTIHQNLPNGDKDTRPWREVVGEDVVVEGIVWGFYEKGLGPYVILRGSQIHVKARGLTDKYEGRPVRVVGTLRMRRHRPTGYSELPGGARMSFVQSSPYPHDVYWIDVKSLKAIDRVSWPWMKVVQKTTTRPDTRYLRNLR